LLLYQCLPQAIAALANEDTKSLGLLGFSDAEANLLALVRRDALQAMLKFRHDKKRLLLKYKENSKREVLHIQFMATTPEVQHKGLAAKLFHHLEATADAHNKDLVIMNTQPRTASLFAEHGFRPWQEYRVGGEEVEGGPVIQILARPPKGGKGQAGANGHPAAHEN